MMIDMYEIYMIIGDQLDDLQSQCTELDINTDYIRMISIVAQKLALEKLRVSLVEHENHKLKEIIKEGD